MKLHARLAAGLAMLVMGALPAAAGAVSYQPEYHPEHPSTPPPAAHPHGHAYGFYCQGASKKHVKGEKGTPFSQCVHAMKQADANDSLKPKKACKSLSKKHVKGQQGTEFSRCVKGVNQMRREQRQEENAGVAASSAV
jgi:hypothetical protein